MPDQGSDPRIELVPEPGRADAWTLLVDGAEQSHVDLGDPTRLEFDYVRRMGDVLDASAPPTQTMRVVHVGGAGLTLARYVAATRPRSPQVVLEPYEALTQHVREHLPLPARSGIKVRPQDGRTGLAQMRSEYADAVVVDAFDGARVPADLTTREALTQAAEVLAPGGVLLLNVTDRLPFPYVRRVVAGVSEHLPHVLVSAEPATMKGRRFGNLLVAASDGPLPEAALRRVAASSAFPYRVLAGTEVADALGGGRPFTDADSSRSPEPPGGATFFR
ncbi:spermidine synthase [Solicola sp. PLA-1-18]|uniref:spermidine synthase n=1 Tax=Solicola sp. PLA-1-18 TaxID=3380532 RepID=UPI003B7EE25E